MGIEVVLSQSARLRKPDCACEKTSPLEYTHGEYEVNFGKVRRLSDLVSGFVPAKARALRLLLFPSTAPSVDTRGVNVDKAFLQALYFHHISYDIPCDPLSVPTVSITLSGNSNHSITCWVSFRSRTLTRLRDSALEAAAGSRLSDLVEDGVHDGFPWGATLTYSILYLSLYIHKANRNAQHTLLSQSSLLLNTVVEPLPPVPDPPAYEVKRAGLAEVLKDRWNTEIEKLVRKIHTTDWNEKRELYERRIASAWSNVRETEKVQELEQRLKENVVGMADEAKQKAAEAKEKTREPRLLELK